MGYGLLKQINIWRTEGEPSRWQVTLGVVFLLCCVIVLALCGQPITHESWILITVLGDTAILIAALSQARWAYLVGAFLFIAMRLAMFLVNSRNDARFLFLIGIAASVGLSLLIIKWQMGKD
jgi:hypothetical protein